MQFTLILSCCFNIYLSVYSNAAVLCPVDTSCNPKNLNVILMSSLRRTGWDRLARESSAADAVLKNIKSSMFRFHFDSC
jgi:hypothetical protein